MAKHHGKRLSLDHHTPLPSVVAAHQLAPFRPVAWKIDWISQSGETFAISNNSPQLPEIDGLVSAPLDYSSDSSSIEAKARQYSQPTPPPSENGSFSASTRKRAGSVVQGKNEKRSRTLPATPKSRAEDGSDSEDEDDDDFRTLAKRAVDVPVNDLRPVYVVLFKMLQQRGCKKIAQAWIKKGEPRKQGVHPYNGGANAMKYADYDPKNPGKHTAPPYWPHQNDWANPATTGARHKEPDHSKVYERLNVLCHLLRLGNKCEGYSFDVDLLEESTKDIMIMHQGHFREDAPDILNDIYRARRMEQQWERGQIPDNACISLSLPVSTKTDRPRPMAAGKKKVSVSAKKGSIGAIPKQDLPALHIPASNVKLEPISASQNLTFSQDDVHYPITPPNECALANGSQAAFGPIDLQAPSPMDCPASHNMTMGMVGIEKGFAPLTPGEVSPRTSLIPGPTAFNYAAAAPASSAGTSFSAEMPPPYPSFASSTGWTTDETWYPSLCENSWGSSEHEIDLHSRPHQSFPATPREASPAPMFSHEWSMGGDFITA